MQNFKILFYCENAYALFSSIPILKKYKDKGSDILLMTSSKFQNIAIEKLGLVNHEILFIEDFASKRMGRLQRLFEIIFVPIDFSATYSFRKRIIWTSRHIQLNRLFYKLRITSNNPNVLYSKIFNFLSVFYGDKRLKHLKPDLLISFTKVKTPYLLSNFDCRHISIMESWDHPGKEPYLINPDYHLSWNRDLKTEIVQVQSLNYVGQISPLKFWYIKYLGNYSMAQIRKELPQQYGVDLEFVKSNSCYLYPMCTSSQYFGFKGEIEFVKDLAKSLMKSNEKLVVRPYPLSPLEDTKLLKSIPNIYVSYTDSLGDGKEIFNRFHNLHKFALLKYIVGVINVGTTFAFDAAMVNCPVHQIILQNDSYGEFSPYSRGDHIKKYLWNEFSYRLDSKNFDIVLDQSRGILCSTKLRNWLTQW